jgi:hypothetical protein
MYRVYQLQNVFWKIKNFLLPYPVALPADEWTTWHTNMKQERQIRYWICETFIDEWIDDKIFGKINEKIWKFKHTYIKKYQYNVVRPSTLKPGYYDEDILMIHTMFHLLVSWVDQQVNDWGDLDNIPKEDPRFKYIKEIKDLYKWWTEIYPNREDTLPEYPSLPPGKDRISVMEMMGDDFKKSEYGIAIKKYNEIWVTKEKEWALENTENMVRLVKLSHRLY